MLERVAYICVRNSGCVSRSLSLLYVNVLDVIAKSNLLSEKDCIRYI